MARGIYAAGLNIYNIVIIIAKCGIFVKVLFGKAGGIEFFS